MTASPHPPEIAEWMGLDTDIEGILLATAGVLTADPHWREVNP